MLIRKAHLLVELDLHLPPDNKEDFAADSATTQTLFKEAFDGGSFAWKGIAIDVLSVKQQSFEDYDDGEDEDEDEEE